MKKIYGFLFFILFLLHPGFSQASFKQFSEQQIRSLLCHKWKLSFLEGMGKKVAVPESVPKLYLGFKPDGSLYEIEGKKNYSGTWTYKHATFTLTTNDQDGKENYSIENITDNLLVIKTKIKGVMVNLGMQLSD